MLRPQGPACDIGSFEEMIAKAKRMALRHGLGVTVPSLPADASTRCSPVRPPRVHAEDALMRRYDVEVPDNLRARRARPLERRLQIAEVERDRLADP